MRITNISDAKAQLSKLIARVMAGEEVIIGKAGQPVAKIVQYKPEKEKKKRKLGVLKGQIWMADDFDSCDYFSDEEKIAFGMMEGEHRDDKFLRQTSFWTGGPAPKDDKKSDE